MTEAQADDEQLLCDEELLKLFNATDFHKVHCSQRYNLIAMGYRTGLRPDSLQQLKIDMFRFFKKDDGVEGLEMHIGSMKNLPATLDKIDSAVFKQTIVRCPDARCNDKPPTRFYTCLILRLCAVAAFERQVAMRHIPPGTTSSSPLFCSLNSMQGIMTERPTAYGSFRGAAEWASSVVGRPLTFKQMSRQVVITKLANAAELSAYDATSYVGIQPRTIQSYHRTSSAKRAKASELLNAIDGQAVWNMDVKIVTAMHCNRRQNHRD